MAIAKIEITCSTCGKTFEHRKECHSRREADSYESWATAHITTCPECSRKERQERDAAALQAKLEELGISLPTIEGVSDKQIAYAQSVRERYLAGHLNLLSDYGKVHQLLNDPEQLAAYARSCEEHGITLDEGIQQNLEYLRLTKVHLLVTSASAREILDKVR